MRQKNKGFTLVEMVITVAIFAILLGILVPSLNSILGFRVQRAANSIASALDKTKIEASNRLVGEMKLEKLFRIAEVLDVTPNKLLPGEAKTASNKFFEFEHMMKQLSEADQELIFNMVMPCMKRLLPNT